MDTRYIKLQNCMNIGITNDDKVFEKFYLNDFENGGGDLIVIIGENNVGKSNILKLINSIIQLDESKQSNIEYAQTDFMGYEDRKPVIKYVFRYNNKQHEIMYTLNNDNRLIIDGDCIKPEKKNQESLKYLDEKINEWFENAFNTLYELHNKCIENDIDDDNIIKKYYDNFLDIQNKYDIDKNREKLQKLQSDIIELHKDWYNYVKDNLELCYSNNPIDDIAEIKSMDFLEKITTQIEEQYYEDKIKEKIPRIVNYEENKFTSIDLVCKPSDINKSHFFQALFKSINYNISNITTAYEKSKKIPGTKKQYEKTINQKLDEIVSHRFNELFIKKDGAGKYKFEITLEENKVYLSILFNEDIVDIEKQSTGFMWFFNFYFNFLYNNNLKKGDIVLMDEPDIHLSIPGRIDLRNFIKQFARTSNLIFIVTTHNPSFVNIDYLEEIRIIKSKKVGKGAEIQNDFSVISNNDVDTLHEIINSFGILHRDILINPNNKVIFVEGISDYLYLTLFKILKQKCDLEEINIIFLPIGGLGKNECEMKEKIQILSKFPKVNMLIDGDEAGNKFKDLCKDSTIKIVQLTDINKDFTSIEKLFDNDDNDHPEYNKNNQQDDSKKSSNDKLETKGLTALMLKQKILKESDKEQYSYPNEKTKNNFNKVFKYIVDKIN